MEVKVEGLAELRELLQRKLPEQIQTKALQSTLAKAAQPIVQEARQLASVDTGRMRKAIKSFRSRASTRIKAVRMIAVRGAYYWRWIEFGHMTRRGEKTVGPPRMIPAKPFMRPAFESRKLEALEVFRKNMATEIQKTAERLHSRTLSRIRRSVGLS